jgi:hypothetical protein
LRHDGEANKAWRFWRAPEFWLLLVTAFATTFALSAWIAVPLTVTALSISSLPTYGLAPNPPGAGLVAPSPTPGAPASRS